MVLAKGSRLGRGISELLGDARELSEAVSSFTNQYLMVSTSLLYPSPFQPREIFDESSLTELSASIRASGIIQPLIVRKNAYRQGYDIIAGERRWRASIMANVAEVPVLVKDIADKECLELSIIENIQREDLTPIEEGEAYRRLIEQFSYKHEELATMMGKSRSHITNMIRILSLPASVKSLLNEKKLTVGHARALINHDDAEKIAQKIIDNGLSVREAEELAKKAQDLTAQRDKPTKNSEVTIIEKNLSVKLGVGIKIEECEGRGRVILSFNNLGQLDMLLHKLSF